MGNSGNAVAGKVVPLDRKRRSYAREMSMRKVREVLPECGASERVIARSDGYAAGSIYVNGATASRRRCDRPSGEKLFSSAATRCQCSGFVALGAALRPSPLSEALPIGSAHGRRKPRDKEGRTASHRRAGRFRKLRELAVRTCEATAAVGTDCARVPASDMRVALCSAMTTCRASLLSRIVPFRAGYDLPSKLDVARRSGARGDAHRSSRLRAHECQVLNAWSPG